MGMLSFPIGRIRCLFNERIKENEGARDEEMES